MQHQAAVVTNNRTREVALPLEYETACRSLAQCVTLDEAKYWDSAADALLAWSKIYRDDWAGREARRVKLKAYRRMGEIAAEIRPPKKMEPGKPGFIPGPASLLVEHGFSKNSAQVMRTLARMPEEKFLREIASVRPRTPSKFVHQSGYKNPEWQSVYHRLQGARSECAKHSAKELAAGLSGIEASTARELCRALSEWLDEFDHCLQVRESH